MKYIIIGFVVGFIWVVLFSAMVISDKVNKSERQTIMQKTCYLDGVFQPWIYGCEEFRKQFKGNVK